MELLCIASRRALPDVVRLTQRHVVVDAATVVAAAELVELEFFAPDELPLTRAAADPHKLTQAAARQAVAPAAAELADELARLENALTD